MAEIEFQTCRWYFWLLGRRPPVVHHLCVLSTYLNKTSWCEYLLVESNIINIFFWRGLPSKLMIFVNLNQANDSVCVCVFFFWRNFESTLWGETSCLEVFPEVFNGPWVLTPGLKPSRRSWLIFSPGTKNRWEFDFLKIS